MARFKVGDIVELITGGPTMAVDLDWADGTYRCSWFAGAKHNSANFDGRTLKRAEKKD
jgi:uncharacterized protein YodC (DUF2158 family)